MKKIVSIICIAIAMISSMSLVACAGEDRQMSDGGLVINVSTLSIYEGQTYQLQATIQGEYQITFESTDTDVATVSESGKITAVSQGECYINVKAGEQSLNCKVTVSKQTYVVEIYFDGEKATEEINLNVGTTIELFSKVYDNGVLRADSVEWQTSGTACTVVKGEQSIAITATAQGSFTVTAKYNNATCSVTVNVLSLA